MVAFAISGVLHLVIAATTGIPPSHTGAMTFFLAQGLGIMVEDAVQTLYRKFTPGKPGPWTRIAGYISACLGTVSFAVAN
jgi:hypothetical protein